MSSPSPLIFSLLLAFAGCGMGSQVSSGSRTGGSEQVVGAVAEADEGDRGGVYGYPGGGDLRIAPYEIAQEVQARGSDIYDEDRTERRVFFLSAHLRPGDSGSALIDPDGEVVGVAFAIAPDRSDVAYALTEEELNAILNVPRGGAVGGARPGP